MEASGVITTIVVTAISLAVLYFIIRAAVASAIRATRDDVAKQTVTGPTPAEQRFFGSDGTPPTP